MKKIILTSLVISLILILFGCGEQREVYETEIKTYVISSKEIINNSRGFDSYVLYFQTTKSTESANVTEGTYHEYQVGDTIKVLVKYWEKNKNNH